MSGVLSFSSLILFLIGCACMLTDALGKPVAYIIAILDILDKSNTNNIVANIHSLDNMYRIVGCCGTNGEAQLLLQLLLVQLLNYIYPNISTSTSLHRID